MISGHNRMLSMLGLARKAGKVASGAFAAENAVKKGRAFLVIVASDASDNTKKNFRDMCTYYTTPYVVGVAGEEMGRAIGQGMRAVLAVTEERFARTIENMINENTDGGIENGDGAE